MEITESLSRMDSPAHGLSILEGLHTKKGKHFEGKLEEGAGSESSGTYAKQC